MASSFDNTLETPTFGTIAKLAENVVYRVPGCSDLMVRKLIREVTRDFCRRSCCLRTTRRILPEEDVTDYPVIPVYGGLVERVVRVSQFLVRRVFDRDSYVVRPGVPVVIHFLNGSPYNPSDENETIEIETVELPSMEGEDIPEWFIMKHGDSVCTGVLARLHMMANRPWSDAQLASKETIAYENAVGFAAADGATYGQYGNQTVDDPIAASLL